MLIPLAEISWTWPLPEAALILGYLSALLLVGSFAIWAKKLRGPLLQRLDGRRTSNAGPAQLVFQLLALAFGLSTLAAVLAIAGWFAG